MLLVKNIAKIVGVDESGRLRVKGRDMNVLGEIDNAWLLADGDRIAAYGTMDKMPEITPDTEVVDAEGGMLFPSFCDRIPIWFMPEAANRSSSTRSTA